MRKRTYAEAEILNANGDFVLTDADQAAETYSRLPTRAASSAALHRGWQATARQGRILFCWLRAASRLSARKPCDAQFLAAICRRNAVERRRAKARPSRRRASAKGRTRPCCTAGFLWQTVERANRALGVKPP